MELKEYLDKTRFDTGITTYEMELSIKQIMVEESMRLLKEDMDSNYGMIAEYFKSIREAKK